MDGRRKVAGVEDVLLAILVSSGTKFALARPVMKNVLISEMKSNNTNVEEISRNCFSIATFILELDRHGGDLDQQEESP